MSHNPATEISLANIFGAMRTGLDAVYSSLEPTEQDRREAHLAARREEANRNTDGPRAGYAATQEAR